MNEIIKQISTKSKEQILNALPKLELENIKTLDPSVHILQSDDILNELITKMNENKYITHLCEKDKVVDKINEITAKYNAQKMLYPPNISSFGDFDDDMVDKINATQKVCFDKDIEQMRDIVFHSDFSVINAAFGVSSHGVLCIHSDMGARMLSLAVPLCIILLNKDEITRSLTTGLERLSGQYKAKGKKLPTNIIYLAGPSRTADIELITVFGVHGSQNVEVIIY